MRISRQATTSCCERRSNQRAKFGFEVQWRAEETDCEKINELCLVLEAELESRKVFADTLRGVDALEAKPSSAIKGIASKKRAMSSKSKAFLSWKNKWKEKLGVHESSLSRVYLEKTVEVENKPVSEDVLGEEWAKSKLHKTKLDIFQSEEKHLNLMTDFEKLQ